MKMVTKKKVVFLKAVLVLVLFIVYNLFYIIDVL